MTAIVVLSHREIQDRQRFRQTVIPAVDGWKRAIGSFAHNEMRQRHDLTVPAFWRAATEPMMASVRVQLCCRGITVLTENFSRSRSPLVPACGFLYSNQCMQRPRSTRSHAGDHMERSPRLRADKPTQNCGRLPGASKATRYANETTPKSGAVASGRSVRFHHRAIHAPYQANLEQNEEQVNVKS